MNFHFTDLFLREHGTFTR